MIDFQALAERLEQSGCGRRGKDVFIDTLPFDSPTGIVLRSSISGDRIDHELPGFMKATFRLIARASNHAEGQAKLEKAIKALWIEQPVEMGTMNVRSCRPITTPMIYPLSPGNLREFSVNMKIIYDELEQDAEQDSVVRKTKTRRVKGNGK